MENIYCARLPDFLFKIQLWPKADACGGDSMRRHFPVAMAVTMATALVATAAPAQRDSPPRTPDGQPDIQGIWNPTDTTQFGLHDIEKGETEEHIKIMQRQQRLKASLIIDPPDGRVP